MWIRGKKKRHFQKALLRESSETLGNPGCGWYHVYPFVLQIPTALSLEETKLCILDLSRQEQLVLVRIDIGAFRSCEIPGEALEDVSRIFGLFRENGKQMIVRFTYDSAGNGMEREPQSLSLIKKHMEQLGKIVLRFVPDILVLQGILIGSWGEMHDSKFLSVSDMADLMNSMYHAVKGSCYLAVRTPKQWRDIIGKAGISQTTVAENGVGLTENRQALENRVGLFNDGMFGSPTDLGTYREVSREDELAWQERFMTLTPNGGEAIADETPVGYRQAAEDMKKMHLCYLNSSYQRDQLDYWKKERVTQRGCWRGLSGYEYIGRHLGSRFVVCSVKALGKGLEIVVVNQGFSGLYEEAECFLLIEKKSGETVEKYVDTDVFKWEIGKKIVLHIPLSETEWGTEEEKIFFQMRRKRDGRNLRFANLGADDKVLLGVFK